MAISRQPSAVTTSDLLANRGKDQREIAIAHNRNPLDLCAKCLVFEPLFLMADS
jgi:hypothetical protein